MEGIRFWEFISDSAARAGSGLLCIAVRPSVRSLSGWVCAPVFSRHGLARRFSRVWSARVPRVCRGCVARPCGAGAWSVSVPVCRRVVSRPLAVWREPGQRPVAFRVSSVYSTATVAVVASDHGGWGHELGGWCLFGGHGWVGCLPYNRVSVGVSSRDSI